MLEATTRPSATLKKPTHLVSAAAACLLLLGGCGTAPKLDDYPATTPKFYSENKAFYMKPLGTGERYTSATRTASHIYEIDPSDTAFTPIKHNDPLSVILQGVRIPEEPPTTVGERAARATRDIAVVLDIYTSKERFAKSLVAFYQRDVPKQTGQMLNFSNLLVYTDPMWDAANPPYFRVRVLDVKAERNSNTKTLLNQVANLSGQISGVIPHPAIPIVNTAIEAASVILSNRKNELLMDFQIQLYGAAQTSNAGGATLGPLMAGQWVVVGRGHDKNSSFWNTKFTLERKTDRLMDDSFKDLAVPYVSLALVKADAQVPTVVLDRSKALIDLLSSSGGKSDVDSLKAIQANLMSAVNSYALERSLQKYRTKSELDNIFTALENHEAGKPKLNPQELARLLHLLNQLTNNRGANFDVAKWVNWWTKDGGDAHGEIVIDPAAPLGFYYVVAQATSLKAIQANLISAVDTHELERSFLKNRTKSEVINIFRALENHEAKKPEMKPEELESLLQLLKQLNKDIGANFDVAGWLNWWKKDGGLERGEVVVDAAAPLGIYYVVLPATAKVTTPAKPPTPTP